MIFMEKKWIAVLAGVGVGALVIGLGIGAGTRWLEPKPLLPPMSSEQIVTKPTPSVILAVKDLQRLESAELHMERVMDIRNKESHLFGFVESEDALLLVAAGDVTAGIDLNDLKEGDVQADWANKKAKVVLPPPKILQSRIDNEHTYVYSRNVDLLAKRKETLESQARVQAEKELVKAATDAGILDRANRNASHTVEGLVRALGYEKVEIVTTKP